MGARSLSQFTRRPALRRPDLRRLPLGAAPGADLDRSAGDRINDATDRPAEVILRHVEDVPELLRVDQQVDLQFLSAGIGQGEQDNISPPPSSPTPGRKVR